MAKTSKQLRRDAAKELREGRNGGSPQSKADNRKRAAAYKSLAENEVAGGREKRAPSKPR